VPAACGLRALRDGGMPAVKKPLPGRVNAAKRGDDLLSGLGSARVGFTK
jgi:hypothetical protein